jgi:hypothetical protein
MGNTTLPHGGAPQCGPRYRSLKRSCLIVTAWLLVAPTPRYVSCRCCGDSSLIVNWGNQWLCEWDFGWRKSANHIPENWAIIQCVECPLPFWPSGFVLKGRENHGEWNSLAWRCPPIWGCIPGNRQRPRWGYSERNKFPAQRGERVKWARKAQEVGEHVDKANTALTRWALGQTLQEAGSREAFSEVDGEAGGVRRQAVAPAGR